MHVKVHLTYYVLYITHKQVSENTISIQYKNMVLYISCVYSTRHITQAHTNISH